MLRSSLDSRRGIALLAALGIMTLVALLVVGGVAATSLAQRSTRLIHADAILSVAADYALASVLSDQTSFPLANLPFGQPHSFRVDIPSPEMVSATVMATRLPNGVLWLVARASFPDNQGRRRVNLIARFPPIGPHVVAPIVARGRVTIRHDVEFLPDTAVEPDCGNATMIEVVVPPGIAVVGIDSERVRRQSTAADSTTYFIAESQLALLAGAPNVLHVSGDTVIDGGSFQGILIVDGSLTIAGQWTARGVVIARGRIDARGEGLSITGALMSFAAPSDTSAAIQLAGGSVRFGGCVVDQVMRSALPPKPVRDRSWADLF